MHNYRRTFLKMNVLSSLYILTTLLLLNAVWTRIHNRLQVTTERRAWGWGCRTTWWRSQGQARSRHGPCLPHSQAHGLNTRTRPPGHLCIILPGVYTQPQTCLQPLWETFAERGWACPPPSPTAPKAAKATLTKPLPWVSSAFLTQHLTAQQPLSPDSLGLGSHHNQFTE